MKDVPVAFPDGLVTICEREDPRDAFCLGINITVWTIRPR